MRPTGKPITILIADDDAEDRYLTQQALQAARLANDIHFVEDGEQLLDYLYRRGNYASAEVSPRPGLILLDLNMPRLDGRQALAAIKAEPSLREIPVVVLTTSQAEEDVYRSYHLGVNSFVTKPVTFEGLAEVMKVIGRYWFEIVELPRRVEA